MGKLTISDYLVAAIPGIIWLGIWIYIIFYHRGGMRNGNNNRWGKHSSRKYKRYH